MAMTWSATVSAKRKRNAVSYVDDDYFNNLELDAAEPEYDDDVEKQTGRPLKKGKTSAKTRSGKKEKPFRFMDLPAELRDEIYDLALIEPAGLSIVHTTKKYRRKAVRGSIATETNQYYYGKRRRQYRGWGYRSIYYENSQTGTIGHATRRLVPNLLAVSKQIRAEASAMLYHQELIFEDTTALHTFVTQIGDHNRKLLTNVTIMGWGGGRGVHKGHNFAALSLLAMCTNLKSLFVNCQVGYRDRPVALARQIYRDGHYFLEGIDLARGKSDAALEVLEICDWNFDYGRSPESNEKKREQFNDELRKLLSR